MSKNDFLKQYLDLPEISAIRFFVFGAALLVNIVNAMVAYLFEILILNHTFWDLKMQVYLIILMLFDIWALSIFIFPKKFSKYFYLYTATAFTGTSLYYLYVSSTTIFLELGIKSAFYIILSILIYILIFVTVILNIVSKLNKKKQYIINNRNTAIVAFIGGAIGVFLPKPVSFNQSHLPMAIVLLVLSCLFTFTSSGFHKFYLSSKINKLVKKEKMQ